MFRLEIAIVSELSHKGTWNHFSQFTHVMAKIKCLKIMAAINIKLWILLTNLMLTSPRIQLTDVPLSMFICVYMYGNISISNIQPIRIQFLCRVLVFSCGRVHGYGSCTILHNCRHFFAYMDEHIMSLDCDSWATLWVHVDDKQAFCGQLCSPVGNVMNNLLTNK